MNSVEAYNLMHKGILALERAERAGIRVDLEYLDTAFNGLTEDMYNLDHEFKDSKFYSDWAKSQDKEPNLNSSMQLGNFLYNVKKRKPPKLTGTGRGSTDKEALLALNIPELNMILESKKLKKIRDYIEGFQREQSDGWLHPSFNLHLVRTFRSSSDKPNFQNIPKRDKQAMKITRSALYPRPGHQLLEVDYGQLEVRIAACYNQDKKLIHDIVHGDMHADMAAQLFKIKNFDKHKAEHAYLRGATKNGFVFPEFYGDYFRNCAEAMACTWGELPKTGKWKPGQGVSVEAGKSLSDHFISVGITDLGKFVSHVEEIEKDFWGNRYKVYARWKEKHWHQYQKDGYVDLLTGFRCYGIMGKNDAINYPIQGAAFHCLLWSLIQLDQVLSSSGARSRIIGQIHDAIVLDVHPDELDQLIFTIKQITTEDLPKAWDWITVPLEVDFEICDVDASWAEKKELEL